MFEHSKLALIAGAYSTHKCNFASKVNRLVYHLYLLLRQAPSFALAIICLEQSLVYLVDEITLLVKLYQLLLKLH